MTCKWLISRVIVGPFPNEFKWPFFMAYKRGLLYLLTWMILQKNAAFCSGNVVLLADYEGENDGLHNPSIRPASSETWQWYPQIPMEQLFSSSFRFVHVATNEIFWKHMLQGDEMLPRSYVFIYI